MNYMREKFTFYILNHKLYIRLGIKGQTRCPILENRCIFLFYLNMLCYNDCYNKKIIILKSMYYFPFCFSMLLYI